MSYIFIRSSLGDGKHFQIYLNLEIWQKIVCEQMPEVLTTWSLFKICWLVLSGFPNFTFNKNIPTCRIQSMKLKSIR